jgi:hypothetical protein
VGSLLPDAATPHAFAQIFMLDTQEASDRRIRALGRGNAQDVLRPDVLSQLHTWLLQHNPWVQQLRAAVARDTPEIVWSSDIDVSGMVIGSVVAAPGSRSIVIRQQYSGMPQFISDGHALYHRSGDQRDPSIARTVLTSWHYLQS